jgi:hypothetical protein
LSNEWRTRISDPEPNDFGWSATDKAQTLEVAILGYNGEPVRLGMLPNEPVVATDIADVEYM